ncbi:SDR family oxidoreductase [bacterium]|nr:SDR family oxidoreductase [bacterium]
MTMRVLVLGGSGTVGSSICKTLQREGCKIAFTYHRNDEAAARLAESLDSPVYLQCDLENFELVRKTVRHAAEALEGLDALIQAAGTSGDDRFWKCAAPGNYDKLQQIDQAAFDEMMAVNTRGTLAACQEAALWLRKNGGGNILFVRSIDGIKPVPSPIHFASSTAAAKGMMEAMSKELGNYNIRVNIIALGILEGGASRKLSHEVKDAYLKHCSLGRYGRAEEVAELATWMAIQNTYVTGQVIILDGGL